jgi:hypothetical protein
VAEDDDAHGFQYAVPVVEKERGPRRVLEEGKQLRVFANDDGAALVEDGQQVAKRAATALGLGRQRARVQRVDARLGLRKSEPGERVEPVVQVFGACRDAAGLIDRDFVVRIIRAGRDKAQRLGAFRFQSGGEAVQIVERARAEKRTDAVEDRVL